MSAAVKRTKAPARKESYGNPWAARKASNSRMRAQLKSLSWDM
jgi:hypothetical protein